MKKLEIFPPPSDRDWVEEFQHENGQYICQCGKCKKTSFGHKRRSKM